MNQLQKFQQKHCLVPDGILGPKTLRKIQNVFGIERSEHLAHFAGQICHETADFMYEEENLNYSAEALRKVFGKYFSYSEALEFAYNPEKIANRVYANRMGNGNEESGDGWKYRGRGAIQLTGKNNYEIFANKMKNLCILSQPSLILNDYFFECAVHYFTSNRLWYICDRVHNENIIELTKRINGGTNGLQDRIRKTNRFYKMLCN